MNYTDIEQETLDLDWFAIDSLGHISHFASAGTPLPQSVANHKDDNIRTCIHFRSLRPTSRAVRIDPEVARRVRTDKKEHLAIYLEDPLFMCARGLYSYDTTNTWPEPVFFRVCSPDAPLHVSDLPKDIAVILMRSCVSKSFADTSLLRLQDIS